MKDNNRKWAGNTGGGNFGRNFLLFFLRFAPVQAGYFLMSFSIPVYIIKHKKDRNAIYSYLRDRQHYTKLKAAVGVVRNFYIFGKIVIDKFAVWARGGDWIDIHVEGTDFVEKFTNQEEGFMLLGAHVGNFELAGYAFSQQKKKIFTVSYDGENAALQANRQAKMSANNVEMVPVSVDSSHIFTLNTALDEGNIVSMTCDRVWGSDKAHKSLFFGAEAKFPVGAFRLAAAKNVKTVALFAMKGWGRKYTVIVKPIEVAEIEGEPAAKKAARLADSFAAALEEVLKRYPLQWFNFYDFWEN